MGKKKGKGKGQGQKDAHEAGPSSQQEPGPSSSQKGPQPQRQGQQVTPQHSPQTQDDLPAQQHDASRARQRGQRRQGQQGPPLQQGAPQGQQTRGPPQGPPGFQMAGSPTQVPQLGQLHIGSGPPGQWPASPEVPQPPRGWLPSPMGAQQQPVQFMGIQQPGPHYQPPMQHHQQWQQQRQWQSQQQQQHPQQQHPQHQWQQQPLHQWQQQPPHQWQQQQQHPQQQQQLPQQQQHPQKQQHPQQRQHPQQQQRPQQQRQQHPSKYHQQQYAQEQEQPQQPVQQQPQQPVQQQPQQPVQQQPQQPVQQQPQQPVQQQPQQPVQQQPHQSLQQQPQQPVQQQPQQGGQPQPKQQQSRQQKQRKPQQGLSKAVPQQQAASTSLGGGGDGSAMLPSSPSSSHESSPPLDGEGDRLQQMSLVKPGTKGRKIPIESNHLSLNVGERRSAVHYDVAITPDTPKSLLRDVMNRFGMKHYPKRSPAFDGRKNLYSTTKLPFGDTASDTIKLLGENGKEKEFKVEIKFARMVDLSPLHEMMKTKKPPQDALQCLDIVLRCAPSMRCIIAGRSFFTPPKDGRIINLGDGMEMYHGFYQSAIRGWKPLLNIDVSHKAFPKAVSVLDLICDLGSNFRYTMTRQDLDRNFDASLAQKLEKFIKTLKIKYEITNQPSSKRIYRVNGLGQSASQARFKKDDGVMSTVEEYFRTVKQVRLRYPHFPCLWVGSREREAKILLPLEFCSVIEGQAVNRKMNENQTSNMIRQAATSTEVRKQKIANCLKEANYNSDPCIREFGFSVSNQLEKLEARVLQPPVLEYANNKKVKPMKGVWRSDGSSFLVGATINKWTIACVTRQSQQKMDQLADMIYKMAGPTGMRLTSKAQPPFTHVSPRQNLQDVINYFQTKNDFDLIFVVVPNSGPQYSYVKQAAEVNVGCLTQCIKERTLFKLNAQTVVNILLKVNSKMNGLNHSFDGHSRPRILGRPCMIMGADVTHPSPDAKDIPSVAAVTASHDPKAFKYNICWRLQPPKVEIIEDLCSITKEQLMFFWKATGHKPETIVFFRDGVSEGQFEQVQRAEIRAIRKACKEVQADGYEPKITFLVVQKRHHTRLFPTNPRDSEDKNLNVPAGTCVDTIITNPMMQDFYLVSHASIQGVAKPTKYCTLWDDNDMSNDDIQELAYHLCHMFTRCNRSVSYPAPTYYAHLAAARAKVYIENDKLDMQQLQKYENKYKIKESICKGKPMFFV